MRRACGVLWMLKCTLRLTSFTRPQRFISHSSREPLLSDVDRPFNREPDSKAPTFNHWCCCSFALATELPARADASNPLGQRARWQGGHALYVLQNASSRFRFKRPIARRLESVPRCHGWFRPDQLQPQQSYKHLLFPTVCSLPNCLSLHASSPIALSICKQVQAQFAHLSSYAYAS